MTTVAQVNGDWFAYLPDRVLGPFKSESETWRAARQETRKADR